MRKTKPKPTAEQLAQAEKLDAEVKRKREREEESFQRCDTDGFLSQWALSIGAERDALDAKILRNGGHATFPVLCDKDGNVIADKVHQFKNKYNYGTDYKWRLSAEDEKKYGRRWIPRGCRSRIQKKLELHEETRWMPAKAAILGSGTGLSGASSCFVAKVKLSDGLEE